MFFRRVARELVAAGGPTQQQATAATPPAIVAYPPYERAGPDSVPLVLQGDAALNGVGNAVDPVALQVQLPANRRARIASFGQFLDGPLSSTIVQWTLFINDVPVPGLAGISVLGRAAGSLARDLDVFVLVPAGARIRVRITDVDGAPIRAGATLGGWTYLSQEGAIS
jgi:hypothetical protein